MQGIAVERLSSSKGTVFTTIAFSRVLNTGDIYDVRIENRNIYLLWAYGAAGSVNEATCAYNRHFDRNFVPTNFLENGGERATREQLLARLSLWREAAASRSAETDEARLDLDLRNSTIPACVRP